MSETSVALLAYCRHNHRVCPVPQRWNTLYEMLPQRKLTGVGWEPPLPLILDAWDGTPPLLKAMRLAEHLEWAAAHGVLDAVGQYLRGLPEADWFHYGD